MAKMIFYDATATDIEQISNGLMGSDHNWHYVDSKISTENTDADAEVVSVFVTSTVTRVMIEAMPKLRLIACRSTGFNNVDMQAAKDHNITVVNVPTYGESTVAEYTFTLLLALLKKLPQTMGATVLTQQDDLMGSDLYGKTIGVIGTGHIGQRVIAIAKGFGMHVVAYDPYPNKDAASKLQYSYKSLDEVMAVSDVVTLHAPLTNQTKHLLNEAAFGKMKQSAVLVNTARGELIDTRALIVAMSEGSIKGAALDVVEGESLMQHSEEVALLRGDLVDSEALLHSVEILTLSKMPNVIVTPHNAFNTAEALQRINNTTVDNIHAFWKGEPHNAVQPPKKTAGKLIMVRHTQSEWNASGQWTGTRNVHLSENGFRQAAVVGHTFKKMGLQLDVGFCSEQVRTLETIESILNSSEQIDVPIRRSGALNERDYGDYTGMNKFEVKDKIGEQRWNDVRRGWDEPVPNGETLKDVYARVVPYFKEEIVPLLNSGRNVLLAAHGNSLRALMKYIEGIPDEAVPDLEMLFGDIVSYELNAEGTLKEKLVTHVNFEPIDEQYKANAMEIARNIG